MEPVGTGPDIVDMINRITELEAAHAYPMDQFLLPVVVLVSWTLFMWLWMFAVRIPAMQKAKIDPNAARHTDDPVMKALPTNVRAVSDNYNHLHEQPTIFYAIMGALALMGAASDIGLYAAWAFVGFRILHSLVQALSQNVTLRFGVFFLGTLPLFLLAGIGIGHAVG